MKCPYCNKELHVIHERHEQVDEEYIEKYTGSCFSCDKMFTWSDIYRFTETTPIKEYNEEEE